MSRTNAGKLVLDAKSAGSAVGAFNVILLEHAEALVAGAELAKHPVILQISENCVNYHKGLKPISVATIAIAESATVPVSVHLDHAVRRASPHQRRIAGTSADVQILRRGIP